MTITRTLFKGFSVAASLMTSYAGATELGGSSYPMGAENYLSAAMPPPGFYKMVYATRYTANKLKDGNGNTLPIDFKVTATAIAPRFVWVTDKIFLGGQVAYGAVVPLVNLDISVNGTS